MYLQHYEDGTIIVTINEDVRMQEIDGLLIDTEELIFTIDLSSKNRDIALGFIRKLLEYYINRIHIIENDNIISFKVTDMDVSLYANIGLFHMQQNDYQEVLHLLQLRSL